MRSLALVLLALGLTACAGPTPTSASLTGTYSAEHMIRVPDGAQELVTDRLAIVEHGDSLQVTLVLLFDSYHICEMHSTLGFDGSTWASSPQLETNETACTLQLKVSTDHLTLRDRNGGCRQTYCGARGAIDGALFERTTRTPDTSWRNAFQ